MTKSAMKPPLRIEYHAGPTPVSFLVVVTDYLLHPIWSKKPVRAGASLEDEYSG